MIQFPLNCFKNNAKLSDEHEGVLRLWSMTNACASDWVKVYAIRSLGAASKKRFVNIASAEKPIYPNFLSVPCSYKSSTERDVAKQNLGKWTLAVPNASKIKIVERIFFITTDRLT